MRILIHGINFSPELTGIGKYTGELGEWLSNNGYEVDVITAPPYYPEWKIRQGFKNFWQTKIHGNLTVMRGPIYVPSKVTALKRIVHEITFTLSTFIYWVKIFFVKYEYIIVVCPVLQSGIVPVIFRQFKNFKLIVHVQDLQVDAAKQLGMVKSSRLISFLEKVEKFIFQNADFVSTISDGMFNRILAKGIPRNKMLLFKNWVDTEFIYPLSQEIITNKKQQLGYAHHDFIVLYSGNMGEKQGLDLILNVALRLKDNSLVKFLLVGDGAAKEELIQKSKQLDLTNVRFVPLVPYEELNSLLNIASVHLVLQKSGATDVVMPSKLGGILASGGFVIVAADKLSDLRSIIMENKVGKCIDPESEEALFFSIQESIKEELGHFKNNARNYAVKEMSKEAILRRFEEFLKSKVKGS